MTKEQWERLGDLWTKDSLTDLETEEFHELDRLRTGSPVYGDQKDGIITVRGAFCAQHKERGDGRGNRSSGVEEGQGRG